jgi:hypothetical protein
MGTITGISLLEIQEPTGLMGRKTRTEEALCLHTDRGNIFLRRSAVEGAGDSWRLLTRRLWNLAKEQGIPFQNGRNE